MQATATQMTTEEQLTEHVARLARKTEALDDFAALVAHDVKSSLLGALRDEDPREGLTRALELVDSILEAVRVDQGGTGVARLAECVQQAIADLGESRTEIVASVTGDVPDPAGRSPSCSPQPAGKRDRGRCGADSHLCSRSRRSTHTRR